MVPDHDESWRAFHDDGVTGTFTTKRSECPFLRGCTDYGTFVSDDGDIRRENVFIDGGGGPPGESARAQWVGNDDKVYELDSKDLVWLIFLDLMAVGWLVWWVSRFVAKPLRSSRARRPIDSA